MARKLEVLITGDAASLSRALGKANKDLGTFDKKASKTGTAFRAVGKAAMIGGAALGGGLAVALKESVTAFAESEKIAKQTEATLKSTGGAANVTAKEIGRLSMALSRKSGIDDEAIQQGQNLLLTFTQIRNEAGRGNQIFNRTTKAAVDMSAAFEAAGKSMSIADASLQLGKALNDPAKGMTRLQRVGVSFTEAQIEQVKALQESGQAMKAQKIILRELEKEFGGAAKAAGQTFAGQVNKLKNELGNLAEEVGGHVAPKLQQGVQWLSRFVSQMRTGQGAGGSFRDTALDVANTVKGLVQSLGPAVLGFGRLAVNLGSVALKFAQSKAGIVVLSAAIGALTARMAALKVAALISSLGGLRNIALVVGSALVQLRHGVVGLNAAIGKAGAVGLLVTAVGALAGALAGMASVNRRAKVSTDDLADSQDHLRDVMQEVRDLDIEAAQRKLTLRQSVINLRAAEDNLAKMRKSGNATARDLRQAELEIDQARLDVKRNTRELNRTEGDATAKRREGTKAVKENREALRGRIETIKDEIASIKAEVIETDEHRQKVKQLEAQLKATEGQYRATFRVDVSQALSAVRSVGQEIEGAFRRLAELAQQKPGRAQSSPALGSLFSDEAQLRNLTEGFERGDTLAALDAAGGAFRRASGAVRKRDAKLSKKKLRDVKEKWGTKRTDRVTARNDHILAARDRLSNRKTAKADLADIQEQIRRDNRTGKLESNIGFAGTVKGIKEQLKDLASTHLQAFKQVRSQSVQDALTADLETMRDAADAAIKAYDKATEAALDAFDAETKRQLGTTDEGRRLDALRKAMDAERKAEEDARLQADIADARAQLARAERSKSPRLINAAKKALAEAEDAKQDVLDERQAEQLESALTAKQEEIQARRDAEREALEGERQAGRDAEEARHQGLIEMRETKAAEDLAAIEAGTDPAVAAEQARLDKNLVGLADHLRRGVGMYKDFVTAVQAVLAPLGLEFEASPDDEAAFDPFRPTRAKPRGKKGGKKRGKKGRGRASGGMVWASGIYRVGELGAENVRLPRGSRVTSASESRAGGPLIGQVVIHNAGGMGPEGVARKLAWKLAHA